MPTKKPKIQTFLEPDIYSQFKEIAEKENRSESQLARMMIEEKVKEYLSENNKQQITNNGFMGIGIQNNK